MAFDDLPVESLACLMNEVQLHTILEEAQEFAAEGKVLHAVQLYRRVMQAMPTLDEPYVRLSQIYLEMGRADLAEKILGTGQARNPDNITFIRMLGEFHLQRGSFRDAVTALRRLAHRRLPDVHFNMGVAYMHLAQWSEAESEFQTTIVLDERWPNVHEALGEVLIRRKCFGKQSGSLSGVCRLIRIAGSGTGCLASPS